MGRKKVPVKVKDERYEKIIGRMERDIEKLKAKNTALLNALKETEQYLNNISKDKTIQEIFQEVLDNTKVNVANKCPKCHSEGMKKINLGYVKIISCSCGYRNRINETGTP
jgi:nitrate/TMAO reductase-like tetraheme cytochrome c subunit